MSNTGAMTAFKRMLTSLVLGANVATLFLLWFCVASTYVPPSLFPKANLIGLAFPFILGANLAFCVFWLLFKARLVWVPVLGIAVVANFVLDYFPCNFQEGKTDNSICILSYNIGHVRGEEDFAVLDSLVRALSPDIICFQENYNHTNYSYCKEAWTKDLGYEELSNRGLVIFSHFHFLGDSIPLNLSTEFNNNALACWLDCNGDSLLLFNCHLESNKLTDDDKSEYKKMILEHEKEQVKSEARMLASKLSIAARYRGMQTDSICRKLDLWKDHSTIVCGDMNDTPISYTYQQLDRRLSSAFRQRGRGIGATMQEWNFPFRIDHLFHSAHWECTHCYVDRDVYASDHYPFVVYLSRKSP